MIKNQIDFRYLLVTHIPFFRKMDGKVVVDSLWGIDLEALAASIGEVNIVAPELRNGKDMNLWGPTQTIIDNPEIKFVGFPSVKSIFDIWKWPHIRKILAREVNKADLIHTSNFFPPYIGLSYAHDKAVSLGKKTLFVIEDFYDVIEWDIVRTSRHLLQYWKRRYVLNRMEARVRKNIRTASMTFFIAPSLVARYRMIAKNSICIKQATHEADQVINEETILKRCDSIKKGEPLILVTACRHVPQKGIDFLIRAMSILVSHKNLPFEARIYGAGPETKPLQILAKFLHVDDKISFPGPIAPGEKLYRTIEKGHIFIMPHRTNDFCRGFFDAMAAGLPVVAFKTPASEGTVRDGMDGLLAPLDDAEGLASAIARFHTDRDFLIKASHAARTRGLSDTRTFWFRLRAEWIKEIMEKR